jgi:hypothetical protein
MPVHRAAELQEQEGDLEAKPLSSAEKNYLKGKQDQLWRLKEAGTTTNRMIERDNHATWCPRKAMEESFEATVALVALFSKAKAVGISPRVAELAKTKVFKGQDRYVTWSKLGHLKAGLLASEGVADLIKRAQSRPSTIRSSCSHSLRSPMSPRPCCLHRKSSARS